MELAEFERASARAREMQASAPRVVAARYDRRLGRVVLALSSKVDVMFAPGDAEGLEKATPAELEKIEISPSGFGVHFPKPLFREETTKQIGELRTRRDAPCHFGSKDRELESFH